MQSMWALDQEPEESTLTYHGEARQQSRGATGGFEFGSTQVQFSPWQSLQGVLVQTHPESGFKRPVIWVFCTNVDFSQSETGLIATDQTPHITRKRVPSEESHLLEVDSLQKTVKLSPNFPAAADWLSRSIRKHTIPTIQCCSQQLQQFASLCQ